MGCAYNKNSHTLKRNGQLNSSRTYSYSESRKSSEKVSHCDFVNQKNGPITETYILSKDPIGKGGYGFVSKATHKMTGHQRAVKVIEKSKTNPQHHKKLENEVNILKKLDHPNILKIVEFYQDDENFYIVMELCNGGELFEKIKKEKKFSENCAANIMRQILSAIAYCHGHKIVHRDLKPENILFDTQQPDSLLKLIDFGTSALKKPDEFLYHKFGTAYYIAPEVIKRKYDEKCDVWSCGVILYVLLCGYAPFDGKTEQEIMAKVELGMFDFPDRDWKGISREAKELIKKCLEFNPESRCSAEAALKDEWITKNAPKLGLGKTIAIDIWKNLKDFKATHRLQQAVWIYLSSFLTNKDEQKRINKAFQALDANFDGMLTKEELISGLNKAGNINIKEDDIEEIMNLVDLDFSGGIEYSEFLMAAISRKNLLSKPRLETAFKLFDQDGNGQLSVEELREFFAALKIQEEEWKDVIKTVDQNGDGQISFKEFKDMMLKL